MASQTSLLVRGKRRIKKKLERRWSTLVGFPLDQDSAQKKRTPFFLVHPFCPAVPTCIKEPDSVHTQPRFCREKDGKRDQNRSAFPHEKIPRKSPFFLRPCMVAKKTKVFFLRNRRNLGLFCESKTAQRSHKTEQKRIFCARLCKLPFFLRPRKWDGLFCDHRWTLSLFFYRINEQ